VGRAATVCSPRTVSVTAAKLVYATKAYSHLFGELARLQTPAFTYMIATAPLTAEQLAPIGWEGQQGLDDAHNLIHYYRLTPDHRIVMGASRSGSAAAATWITTATTRPGSASSSTSTGYGRTCPAIRDPRLDAAIAVEPQPGSRGNRHWHLGSPMTSWTPGPYERP
jgi:hypothetical protein